VSREVYRDSTTGGATWGSATVVIQTTVAANPGGHVYARTASVDEQTHMFIYTVPQVAAPDNRSWYLWHIYHDGTDWKEYGGAALTPPIDVADLTPIISNLNDGEEVTWVDAVVVTADDPRCLAFDGGGTPDAKYVYRSEGVWATQTIGTGTWGYFNFMTLDAADPAKLVVAGPTHITELSRAVGGCTEVEVLWSGAGTPAPANIKAVKDARGMRFIAPLWSDFGSSTTFLGWEASLWGIGEPSNVATGSGVRRVDLNASRPDGGSTVLETRIAQRNLVSNPRFYFSNSDWPGATRNTSPGVALPEGADACGYTTTTMSIVVYANDSGHSVKFVPGDTYSVRGDFYAPGAGIDLVFTVVWEDYATPTTVYNDTAPAAFTSESLVVTVPTVGGYESGFAYATLTATLENS
jgi:hypothetical protein